MTCWSTDESWDTTLVLAVLWMDGRCVMSERVRGFVLPVSVDPHEMSWVEVALALALLCQDLKPEDLLRPFHLMWSFKKLNLSSI